MYTCIDMTQVNYHKGQQRLQKRIQNNNKMQKLKLLIIFLLVGYNSISQNVIKNNDSVVTINKNIAKKVIEDLIKGDACKKINTEQNNRINNFKLQIEEYKILNNNNDSIINNQKNLINIQNKLLSQSNKVHIHGYIAIQTIQLTLVNPVVYAQVMLEYKKWNLGPIYYVQKTFLPNWGIILQYQIF